MPAGLLGEAIDLLRPRPVPAAGALGGEEGIEERFSRTSVVMPLPVSVTAISTYSPVRTSGYIWRVIDIGSSHARDLDRQLAAARHHGIAGVERQGS